ncbi:MAG: hypothetical protein A2V45_09445 [Candidatus Aminicenantes bacterium RBG_19FT_COMBO_58_17]|nr:MAG: hypothetical protein A2V45_09445 [Candidatus Aminicenantes bacterium RBG_19FT_COMBO_58_17]
MSRPWIDMARAIMKLPRKRKMMGSEKCAKPSLTPATPVITQSAAPNNDGTGMGMGSVIHQTMTHPMMAAKT